MSRSRGSILGVLLAVATIAAVRAGSEPEHVEAPGSVLTRLVLAHELRPEFAVESRSPAVSLDPAIESLFKGRDGWWNPRGEYFDPIAEKAYPILTTNRYACNKHSAVAQLYRRFAGPPAGQATPLRQLVSPTIWVEQHGVDSPRATYIRYTPSSAANERAARRDGRVAHSDVLGALIYPALVQSIIHRLAAASDLTHVQDGDISVLSSEDYEVTAWIDQDGALTGASMTDLVNRTDRRRYAFSGSVAAPFFPARFPAEVRTYRERASAGGVWQTELIALELFSAPEPLTAADAANLDMDSLGLELIERTGGPAPALAGMVQHSQRWLTPSRRVLVIGLLGLAAYGVCRRALRRGQQRQ